MTDSPLIRSVSNWGKWGANDQIGTLNYIDAAAMRRGFAAVRQGKQMSLSLPIRSGNVPVWPDRSRSMHFMTIDGGDYAIGARAQAGMQVTDDYIFMACQGGTHIDAFCHVFTENTMYNSVPSSMVRSFGARALGVDQFPGIITRGIMLDVAKSKRVDNLQAGYPITSADLEECVALQKVTIEPGDALLIRTGWMKRLYEGVDPRQGEPGIGMSTVGWLAEKCVSLVASDSHGVEVAPAENQDLVAPVHIELLRNQGLPLMELLQMDEMAAQEIWEFLFVAVPLKITGGTGSPINPIVVY